MSSNESFPSVSQIVEQIIESLSESISQLMMMVIILQERNADPPPALPNGVGIVTGSANTLYQTAMALASEDYKEYPDIKNEIEVAAQSVNTSSQELNTSLQSLMSTGDKRSGWDGLVKSCKNMSAKTIRLLQIVYGAERERVFRAAQKALDALRNIDPNKASSDGKSFAQQVGEAATKANQLAEYMRGKAEDATPQKRRELLGLADELNAGAKHLIDDANQLLRDPNNPQLKKQVAEDLKDVKNTIDRSVNALKDMDHEFDDAANDFEARSAAMRDSLRDLEAGGLDSYDADILLTAKKERQEMDNLLDDIDGNNPERAKRDLENAKLLNDKLAQLAGMEANNVSDHAKKSELQNIKPVLGQLFNTYENAARNAIMHPHDQSYLDGLDAAHDALDAAIQKLCDLLSNPNAEIDASARKEIDDLDNVRAAVIEGNQPDVTRNAKAAIKENKTLAGLCAAQAGKATDPLRKRTILDAVDELQRLLPHQLLAAKQALESPTPDNIKHMNDKTDTMQDQIRATALLAQDYPELELLDAAKREKELISKVQGAGTNGDGRGVATFAPQLIDNTKNLGNIAREIAKKKPRGQQARILDSVNKLERLAGPACNDAKALAQNPQNAAAKQGLDKKMEDMRALVDKLVTDTDAELFDECLKQLANLHHMKNSADEGDLGGLADAATSTANTHNRLAPLANAAARRCEDPQRRKQIEEDINELTKALPKGIGQTNEFLLEPTDAKRKPLKNTVTLMEGLVKGLSDPQKYDPTLVRGGQGGGDLARQLADLVALAERLNRNPNDSEARRRLLDLLANLPLDALDTDAERLANLIREQVEALDRLTNAAEAGNKAGVEAAGADMNRIQPKIREQASKMLGKILDPEKQQKVVRALDTIDKLIPPTIDSARKVAANPRDQVARKRMHDQADDIRDQLNILADNAISTNEQRLREAAEREKEALERLRKAVKAGDVPGAKEAINDVKKYNAILTEECRDCAQQVRDPALNKRILDNVNELERLMPILAADCVKGASSPSDLQAQKRALDDIQKCEDLINSLLRDTRADAIALAQIEDGALTEMEQHCKSGDPACANDIRKIIETQKNLKVAATEAAKSLPNERAQANIRNALAELDQLLPAHVNHGKNQLQAPSEKNRDALSDSTTCMRAPLAQIIATLRPTPENIADANAKREAALLAALRAAAARGDKQEVERLLPEINNMNNRLVAQARTEADKIAIPEKAKALRDAATELEGLEKLLAGIARDAANNPNDAQAQAKLAAHTKKMENAMQKIVDILKDKQDTPAGKARRLANALIRMLNSDNMDPGKFLAAAKALANYINSLNLDGSDFDLTAELNKLNKLVSTSNKLNRKQAGDSLDGIMRGLQNAKKPAPVAVIPKTVPKTFEEHIQAVADDIDNHVLLSELGPNDPVTILIRAIAAELTKLANSAKAGKRQDMVVAGRTACQKINELHVLLGGEYANRCKDPRTKERLLRAMQAMKTFSTQMKILTAVKAASGKDKDADTEDQLVSVTKSLGNALNESVSSVKVMKGGRLLQ